QTANAKANVNANGKSGLTNTKSANLNGNSATNNSNSNTNTNEAANNDRSASGKNSNSASGSTSVNEGNDPYEGKLPPAFKLFGLWFQPTLETRLILLVMLAGAIGSYVHAASSLVDYLGNRTLVSSWVWWYLLRPFIGMMLALIFYFGFRGGFITGGVNTGGEGAANFINPFGIAATA